MSSYPRTLRFMDIHLLCNACALQRFQLESGSVFQSISLSSRTFKESTLKSLSAPLREFIGNHLLMDKDVGIACAPSRFHAVVFECFTEGISPGDAVL